MGGRQTRPDPEYVRQVERRDRLQESNQREMESLRSYNRDQEDRMRQELASRNADLDRLRRNVIESNRKNEEELRATRQRQAERAEQLEKERAAEMAGLRNSSDAEKQKVNQQYEQRAAQLKKEHDEVIRKTLAEKEEERRKAEAAIQKAEKERDEVEKQKLEDVKNHRKALDQMAAEHRKQVEEHYEKLNEEMEKQTLAAIDRIALETEQRMAIVDAAQAKMQKDAIETQFRNFAKEYLALMGRAKMVAEAIGCVVEVMPSKMIEDGKADPSHNNSNSIRSNQVPDELSHLHSEYLTEAAILERQMSKMKQRLKTNFDIPEDFKDKLMEPLVTFEQSASNVKSTSIPINMAVHKNDASKLGAVREKFLNHLEVLQGSIRDMNAIEYKREVETALEKMAQKSIQQ